MLMDTPRRPHLKFSPRQRGPPPSLSHEQPLALPNAFKPSTSRTLPLASNEGSLSLAVPERNNHPYSYPVTASFKPTALASGSPAKAKTASRPPIPYNQKEASAAPTQYRAKPIYRLQKGALYSPGPPKMLPHGEHGPQGQVSQPRGSSDSSSPGANAPSLTPVTPTQELTFQRPPVPTNPNAHSVHVLPSSIVPLGAMASKPSAALPPPSLVTSNTTSTPTYPRSNFDPASATEAYNTSVANQVLEKNSSSGAPGIGITAIIIMCLIVVSMTGMGLYWGCRRHYHRRLPLQKRVVEPSASRTKFPLFGEREGSIQESISQAHSIVDHPPGPLINCRSEGFVSYSEIISDAYSSPVRPPPTNVIEGGDGANGNKTMHTKEMSCVTPLSRPMESKGEKSFLDYSDRNFLPGSIFVAAYSFHPSLPDELPVSAGNRVQVKISYNDGWCFGTNLDAELRSVAREAPLVTTGVFPLQCLEVAAARQSLVSSGESQLLAFSAKPPEPGTSSDELPEHIKSRHQTLSVVPETDIKPGGQLGCPDANSSKV